MQRVAGLCWLAGLTLTALLAAACSSGSPAAGSGGSSGASPAGNLAVALGKFVQIGRASCRERV